MRDLTRYRRIALYAALFLAVTLLCLDRTAAYLHRPGPDARAVVIYTTAWCPFCKKLRAHLDAHHVAYTDYDVEKSFNGGMGFWALRGRGVPVSVVGPAIIYGFDVGKIDKALTSLGYEIGTPPRVEPLAPEAAEAGGASRL